MYYMHSMHIYKSDGPFSPINDAIRKQFRHRAHDIDRAIDTTIGHSDALWLGTSAIDDLFCELLMWKR